MVGRIEHGGGWYSIEAADGSSVYYGPGGRVMGKRPADPNRATSPISTPAQPSVVPATGAPSGGTPLAWQGNTLSGAGGGTPGTSMEPRPPGLSGNTATGVGPTIYPGESAPSASGGGGESSSNQASSSRSPSIGAGAGTGMTGAGAGAGGANMATPNTSAGGYDNALLQNLMKQFQTSTAASNKAGTAQYKNLMKSVKSTSQGVMGSKGTYAQANALLAGFGKSGEADIAENAARQAGNVNQDMISRGLGNTTIRSTMLGGVDRDAQRARTLLADQLTGQRVGLLRNQAGTQMDLGRLSADSILSKQNLPPEQALYLKIMEQLARGTGAGTAATGGAERITLPPVYNYNAGPSWLESRFGR